MRIKKGYLPSCLVLLRRMETERRTFSQWSIKGRGREERSGELGSFDGYPFWKKITGQREWQDLT